MKKVAADSLSIITKFGYSVLVFGFSLIPNIRTRDEKKIILLLEYFAQLSEYSAQLFR